jgi:hypothetical protein
MSLATFTHFDSKLHNTVRISLQIPSLEIRPPFPSYSIGAYKGAAKPTLVCPFKCPLPFCFTLPVKLSNLQILEGGAYHAIISL